MRRVKLSKVKKCWELEFKVSDLTLESVLYTAVLDCSPSFGEPFLTSAVSPLAPFPQSFCRNDDLQHLPGCHLVFSEGYFMSLLNGYSVSLQIPCESGVSRIPSISHLMFLVNALPMIEIQQCLMRSWWRPVHFAPSHGRHLRVDSREGIILEWVFVQDGLGKDDGRLHKKPPSVGRIIQNSVRASSRAQIYSFIHCLTYSFTHLFNPPFAHSFADGCVHPTVTEWLVAPARCSASPGDKMVHKTLALLTQMDRGMMEAWLPGPQVSSTRNC